MTILVAYSQTNEGHAALEHGVTLASRDSAPLVIFALDHPSSGDNDDIPAQPIPDAVSLDGLAVSWLGPDHQSPDATGDLLDKAEEISADTIVVGVRRRSRVGKLILGSMAQKIIIGANVPVVAVKAAVNDA